jgi:Tol biopolymer transport system component
MKSILPAFAARQALAAVVLFGGVAVANFGGMGATSADTGTSGRMAFVNRQGTVNHIYLMDVTSSGMGVNAARITTDAEAENYPSWSPDGQRLVYQRDFNGSAIYMINVDGTGQRRLSPAPGFDVTPSWSADGARIVYARLLAVPQPNVPPLTDIRVMNADGSGDHSILANTVFSVEPRWSVNGRIVFMSNMNGPNLDIYVINDDGTDLTRLTHGANNGDPVWSPDGNSITFGSDREGGNKLNVFVMNADGSQQRPLTHFDVPYEAGDTNWSSDGATIAFEYDINGMKQSDPDAYAEVWTMNADGSGQASTGVRCSGVGCAPRWQPKTISTIEVVEYYHAGHDHYFIASLPVEINALDSGQFPGWTRTGFSFRAYPQPVGNASPVCRFYIPPGRGDSHFYSASPDECAIAKAAYPFFVLESANVMYVDLPDQTTGACPPGDVPVYRIWDARIDTNHRYTTLPGVRAQMVAKGWVAEGYGADQVIMCSPRDSSSPSTAQMVFMKSTTGAAPPGPSAIYEIAVMNLDGSGFRQLTNDGKMKMLPHFSPDATKIAYTKYSVGSYADPNAVMDIAVYDVASGTEQVITHDGSDANATWSPDGSRVAYINATQVAIWTIAADGSNPVLVAKTSGAADDKIWGDLAWSRDNWLLFTVGQTVNGCFKVRTDKIRPDGTQRTQLSDGGPNCTPAGFEQSGDADPGWSADGRTIYSSRGFPERPAGPSQGSVVRKLYAFSSDAWYPGKPEADLSLTSEPACVDGVPKGSPDGKRVLLSRGCFFTGTLVTGIYITDSAGSYRTRITDGFGPDWNPVAAYATSANHR